jgi:transcriptional regulator of arginine metabolism
VSEAARAAGTPARARRQKLVAELIRGGGVTSQEELVERLAAAGLSVTQATVSRDLDELGAVKMRRGGGLAYALPDQLGGRDWSASRLQRVLGEWVEAAEAAGPLIVLRTPPASAHVVGLALDQAALPEIAGVIAGDDTLFIAVREGAAPAALLARLRALAGLEDA